MKQRSAGKPDIELGKRIRLRRVEQKISQAELGEKLGVSFQQVQKYEKGANRIGASRLFDLSHVLGVPVQFFYDEAPAAITDAHTAATGMAERASEPYVADVLSSRDSIELNKAFARISDARVRRAVVELVKSLAGEAEHG